jgi:hypothetical protein
LAPMGKQRAGGALTLVCDVAAAPRYLQPGEHGMPSVTGQTAQPLYVKEAGSEPFGLMI